MVTENSHLDGRPDIAPSPWNQHFRIYYLTEKMRSAKDPFFSALSDRVKVGRLVEGDTEYFKSRITPCTSELSNESFKSGKLVICVTTNAKKNVVEIKSFGHFYQTRENTTVTV